MSIDALNWAWRQKVRMGAKVVLLSLADRADEEGNAWPSVRRLKLDTGLDERSIYRIIKKLSDAGLVSIMGNPGKENRYHLVGINRREDTPDKMSPLTKCHPCQNVTPDKNDRTPLTKDPHTPDILSAQRARLPNEPKEEPKENPQTRARASGPDYSASFLEFWAAYPQKIGKDAAFKAWKNAKKKHPGITPGQLISAIKAQSASGHFQGRDGQDYIPHPATWLNQGRWNDELPNSRASPSDISSTVDFFKELAAKTNVITIPA